MGCNRSATILHGYFDSELDALGAADFERHLEQCANCIGALEALESMRWSLNAERLYEQAPAELRQNILARIGAPGPVAVFPTRAVWQWLAVAAALVLVTYTGLRVASLHRSQNYETVLAAEIIDAHLRSLQPGHLIDVVHGRSVAALVYGRRRHVVNVFIWPTDEKASSARSGSQQGYQWTAWRARGMEFCAVSDAAPSALEQLRSLLAEN